MVAKIAIRKVGEADGLKIPRPATWNLLLARASRDLLGGAAVGKVTDNQSNDAIMEEDYEEVVEDGDILIFFPSIGEGAQPAARMPVPTASVPVPAAPVAAPAATMAAEDEEVDEDEDEAEDEAEDEEVVVEAEEEEEEEEERHETDDEHEERTTAQAAQAPSAPDKAVAQVPPPVPAPAPAPQPAQVPAVHIQAPKAPAGAAARRQMPKRRCNLKKGHNIRGVTKAAIRRLARRGGVKIISGLVYEETRNGLKVSLTSVIDTAVKVTKHQPNRKTVKLGDVLYALTRHDRKLYGVG